MWLEINILHMQASRYILHMQTIVKPDLGAAEHGDRQQAAEKYLQLHGLTQGLAAGLTIV
jgi:hypothetical protein